MQTEERYEIKGKIGEGGRGAVYRAYDRQLNRNVAIKRLLAKGVKEGEEEYEAIIKESHALSAINSPHIVRVYDFEQDEDGPYVVMEYLDGKTLHEVVSHAPLVEGDFVTVAEQALEALIAAHQAKLLHRDIKPGNLMLTWLPSGRIQLKLLDFGLAKFSERPAVQTIAHDSSVLGSIYFMAPEQFERTPLDARTDLYSLGCVLFYSLTGQYPFQGGSPTEVMAAHIQGSHPDLKALRPDIAPALCDWVQSLLARQPEHRPTNAQAALDALEQLRASVPISTPTTTTTQPTAGAAAPAPAPTQPVPPMTATGPVPGHPGAVIPVETITSTVMVAPRALGSVRRTARVPVWVYITCAALGALIVIFGIASMMRGDPSNKVPPPNPAKKEGEVPLKPNQEDPTPLALPKKKSEIPVGQLPISEQFKRRDKDGDLKVSRSEYVFARKDPKKTELEEKFVRLDVDKDGYLTLREFKVGFGKNGKKKNPSSPKK